MKSIFLSRQDKSQCAFIVKSLAMQDYFRLGMSFEGKDHTALQ